MAGASDGLYQLIYEAFGWLQIVLQVSGFVICLRYVRLSWAMPLLVLAFAGFSVVGISSRLFMYAVREQILPGEGAQAISLALAVFSAGSSALLVCGLLLVVRDIRERFHFLREASVATREDNRGEVAAPGGAA